MKPWKPWPLSLQHSALGFSRRSQLRRPVATFTAIFAGLWGIAPVLAQNPVPRRSANPQTYAITLTSPLDGPIAADATLTLREAIALTNADITLADLSPAEQSQVKPQQNSQNSDIRLELPPGAAIQLQSPLPPLRQAGLTLNGNGATLASAPATPLPWGLLVMADNITLQNLQLQGFHSRDPDDYPFVGGVVVTTGQMLYDLGRFPDIVQLTPPQNFVLEDSQLVGNGFGVVLFEAQNPTLQGNQFRANWGSGLLTGKTAQGLQLADNLFWGNGDVAQADAVRLEGEINGTTIVGNTFCQNAGAGVFLFKPEGSIAVEQNLFARNGHRSPAAALYLMGSGHRVQNNRILDQNGPGIAVAGYPRSVGNNLQDNLFAQLQGLSIDLVTRQASDIQAFRVADGPNPRRQSHNRRQDTGNGAVQTPQFAGLEFFPFGDRVKISGSTDPDATVDLYRVLESGGYFGPLSEFVERTTADGEGNFEFSLVAWELGDRLTAIATDPAYGTSEPAENAIIRNFAPLRPAAIDRPLPLPDLPALCQELPPP